MTERIRLADLEEDAPEVELPNGQVVKVKRLDGVAAGLWFEWTTAPQDRRDPRLLWQVAARCLPDIPQQVIDTLTPEQAGAVIAVASGRVEQVLAVLRNGRGAETLVPDSSPATPSAPSSSTSPVPVDVPHGTSP